MKKTSETLSREVLSLLDRRDLQELYLAIEPDSQDQFLFSAYLFLVTITLIISSGGSNPILPQVLSDCHKQMLFWWGDNRSVRCGAFVKSPTELMMLLKFVENRDQFSLREGLWETKVPLYSLIGLCLFARIELYSQILISSKSSLADGNSVKFLSLAEVTQSLITGKAVSEDESGPNPHLHAFKIMALSKVLKEYMEGVNIILCNN